jgi:alpha-glucosidase
MPYIRMMAGPVDYTPGAMRNASKRCFRPVVDNPMSMGTRCHQMAMYVAYDAPLQMLADNPTVYMKEQECTDFIARIPTVFDETVPLDGQVSEFLSIAKRKGTTWYVGALTQWQGRDLKVDFSFLGTGNYQAEILTDGINAERQACDYKRQIISVDAKSKMNFTLASGGGLAIIIRKK